MRLLEKFRKKPPVEFHLATERDIYYCYRLFLNRESDPEGFAFWKNMIQNHRITLEFLTDSFLYSNELQKIQAQRDELVLVTLPEFKMYVRLNDYFIGAHIAREKSYEPHVTRELRRLLRAGMTFLDIGANIGYFALLAAECVGEDGTVLAFEPVERNRDALLSSIEVNKRRNITLYPFAVGERQHRVALDIGGKSSNSRVLTTIPADGQAPVVEVVALDEFLPALPRLDVVKMDIEGAESQAVRGMRRLIEQHRPVILTEFSPDLIRITSGIEPDVFLDELCNMGYELFEMTDVQPIDGDSRVGHRQLDTGRLTEIYGRLSHLDHVDILALPCPLAS